MPTAPAKISQPWLHRRARSAERGQIMPIFAAIVGVIILFASLLIDGSFAFQTFRDLDTIAYHSARAGANAIAAPCTAAPGANCPLNQAQARGRALAWANSWAAQDGLTLKAVDVTFPSPDTISVHIRVCYVFFLHLAPVSSAACPGTWQLDSTQTARSLVGP